MVKESDLPCKFGNSFVHLVPQLSPNIQKNCAFCDTSTKFATNVH